MEALTLITALLSIASGIQRAQLIRFARSVLGTRVALQLEKEGSDTRRVERLAQELVASGKLDDSVFDRLHQINPKAGELIERARSEWQAEQTHGDGGDAEAAPEDARLGEHARDYPWLRRLEKRLATVSIERRKPAEWLVEALSMLASFDPVALAGQPMLRERADVDISRLLVDIASIADPRPDGRWAVALDTRRAAIARMATSASLASAVATAEAIAQDDENQPYLLILRQFLADRVVPVRASSPQAWLIAAREIGEWFAYSEHAPVDQERVATILAARERIEPLRKLVGSHFFGRAEQLAMLRDERGFGPERRRLLALTGVGGVGKSALLGRHILDLLDQDPPPPVVYIDFDRSEADPTSPRRLIELIAKSLTLLYAGTEEALGFAALESVSGGDTDAAQFEVILPADADEEGLLRALAEQVDLLPRRNRALFVFDTFEQVMTRGPAVVARFTDFLAALLDALPFATVILSGRGHIGVPLPKHELHLQELDSDSADEVLKARGIEDREVRRKVIESMGTSPLVLRIASTALLKGELDPRRLDLYAPHAEGLRLHAVLYSRVLSHLGDPEVERLAHPGLVVRRVTPGVIRSVLAEICQIRPERADELFERLPNFVELFEPDDRAPGEEKALRHRQDLREDVLDIMINDPAWADRIPRIHRKAVAFYAAREDPVGRAEELYHSLMLNEEQERLDALWSSDLAASLARSWPEPLPPRARKWLAHRLGYDAGVAPSRLRLIDWEERAARLARSSLEAKQPAQALDQLRKRRGRTPTSPATLVEIEALRALGRSSEALAVVRKALSRVSRAAHARYRLELLLLGAETALQIDERSAARALAAEAAELAKALVDEKSRLRALELCARDEGGGREGELEMVFVNANPDVLLGDRQTVARVIESVGRESSAVLIKAAETFATQPSQTFLKSDPNVWKELFETVAEHEGGRTMLVSLAKRAGLSAHQADPLTVASGMVRYGLQGEALAQVLGSYGSDRRIREQSVATFGAPANVF